MSFRGDVQLEVGALFFNPFKTQLREDQKQIHELDVYSLVVFELAVEVKTRVAPPGLLVQLVLLLAINNGICTNGLRRKKNF